MLSQRMAKTLFALETEYKSTGTVAEKTIDELNLSARLFDETLIAFMVGGTVSDASGKRVNLEKSTASQAIDALNQAEQRWRPYQKSVVALGNKVKTGSDFNKELTDTLVFARENNLLLLKLMNDFTVALEAVAVSKANRLRLIQTVGISLAIINFLFIMFHFLRQLRESDAVLDSARAETLEILDNVNEGLFLINKNLLIGTQYSTALERIFGRKDLAGQPLLEVLDSMVNPKEAKTTADFVGLLFNPKIREKLIADLNPLEEIEVSIYAINGMPENRVLSFNFSRAIVDGDISHVLVTVLDVTTTIKLARELNAVRDQTDKQVEMLTGLLHTNPALLQDFIANAYNVYSRINNVLKLPGKTDSIMRTKLNEIFMLVHNFKGDALALKLDSFARKAHNFEDEIAALKSNQNLTGNDFLSLAIFLDDIIAYTQQIEILTQKMAAFSASTKSESHANNYTHTEIAPLKAAQIWQPLTDLVEAMAKNQQKSVCLVCSGLTELNAPALFVQGLKAALIQLLRNAVTHGIEPSDERLAMQKMATGRVDIRAAILANGDIEVSIQDDGAGFNYDALREQALTSGRWTLADVESWDKKQLVATIFDPDVTTATALTEDAGRGVGMAAVLAWVNENRGKIKISSRPHEYTRFVLTFSKMAMPVHVESEPVSHVA